MEKKWHPLQNPKLNSHYVADESETTIEKFEKVYTIIQLMNWAEITADKYFERMDHKNQKESDCIKREDYLRYYTMLREIKNKCHQAGEMSASKIYEKLGIEWRYR